MVRFVWFGFCFVLLFEHIAPSFAHPTSRPHSHRPTTQPTTRPSTRPIHPPWPTLPTTNKAYQSLIKRFPAPPYDEDTHNTPNAFVVSRILLNKPNYRLIAGWQPIFRELQKAYMPQTSSILLWGTAHDSRAQFDRFISFLGGTGVTGIQDVIVEMFYGDGQWKGIPFAKQRGDNALLKQIVKQGSSSALKAFAARQRRLNHVVWQYGYLDAMVNFPLFARGRGLSVYGCELPPFLRKQLPVGFTPRLRIREYHCVLANRLHIANKRQIAMFWGRGHIGPDAVRRFISYQSRVTSVYVYGGGKRLSGLEMGLKDDIGLMAPLLIPLRTLRYKPPGHTKAILWLRRYVLLLPHALADGHWRYSRRHNRKQTRHNLVLKPGVPLVRIGTKTFPTSNKQHVFTLPPGDYVLRTRNPKSKRLVFGHIRIFKRGTTTLRMYQKRLYITYEQTQ